MLCVYLHRTPKIYENDRDAQLAGFPGSPPVPLHFEPDPAAVAANRGQALRGEAPCDGPLESLDEYPFASTKEGGLGSGRKAQVRCVPVAEQKDQSRDLRVFYRIDLARRDAAPLYVVPVPW